MRKKDYLLPLASLLVAVTAVAAAADPPYAGTWKMNLAKSDFGESSITYEQLPSGEMKGTVEGQTFSFKLDEKDYPGPFGLTVASKALGADSWQMTWKLNGKVMTTDTAKLSADGKSLTVNAKGTKPNGDVIDDTILYERVSGGPGLAGKWKTKNVKASSPTLLELAATGTDGLMFKVVDMDLSCEAKLDGKDYPCTGPTLAPGWTVALTSTGPRSFDMLVKSNGKPVFKTLYTVSEDGKTLTGIGSATATNEKVKVVYDRQ
jgi:hypothetical protein